MDLMVLSNRDNQHTLGLQVEVFLTAHVDLSWQRSCHDNSRTWQVTKWIKNRPWRTWSTALKASVTSPLEIILCGLKKDDLPMASCAVTRTVGGGGMVSATATG